MPDSPKISFDSFGGGRFPSSWRFGGYVKTVAAITSGEVAGVLEQVEQAAAEGLYAAGFVSYEAATALNPDLPSLPPVEGVPLVWFAFFRERTVAAAVSGDAGQAAKVTLEPRINLDQYSGNVEGLRNYIACGDCYQVNYTFPLQGVFQGDLRGLYRQIGAAQRAPFGAYLETGRFTILSASPELFFSKQGEVITTRPMKGTAGRGRWAAEDQAVIGQLRNSPKEQAENLMIVDLLRNDLGIVAETGSVTVDSLFEVETYPTVHQMTSAVSARLRPGTGLTDIFRALFPCGSVTGAPKRRAMEIIADLEEAPRGVYCGAIGFVAPGGEALFSVAIRTLLFDADKSTLTMGVGSGITWDSTAAAEYDECISKGAFIGHPAQVFRLLESLRLEQGEYSLLDRHVARLVASAQYFGFHCNEEEVRQQLARHAGQTPGLCKVRLLLSADGGMEISSELLLESADTLFTTISSITVASGDSQRYHKTTRRVLFEDARAAHPDFDEVLFVNEHCQLTEGSYHSLVVSVGGRLMTPPLSCGLLPGVLRQELLETGKITEQILYPEDLQRADEVWLINSVRGWRRCVVL